jgi:hypothetical protein
MHDCEWDKWENAILAITGVAEAKLKEDGSIEHVMDPRPLATLLRGDKPIPISIQHTIADLLDPPPESHMNRSFDIRLSPIPIKTSRKQQEFMRDKRAFGDYTRLCKAGKSAEEARIEVCKKYNWQCDESIFNRHLAKVREHLNWVRTGNNSG